MSKSGSLRGSSYQNYRSPLATRGATPSYLEGYRYLGQNDDFVPFSSTSSTSFSKSRSLSRSISLSDSSSITLTTSPSISPSFSITPTLSESTTGTGTVSYSPSSSLSESGTRTISSSSSRSASDTTSRTGTKTSSLSESATRTISDSSSRSASDSVSRTRTGSSSFSGSKSISPSKTSYGSISGTRTPSATPTISITPSISLSPTTTPTISDSRTKSPSITMTPSTSDTPQPQACFINGDPYDVLLINGEPVFTTDDSNRTAGMVFIPQGIPIYVAEEPLNLTISEEFTLYNATKGAIDDALDGEILANTETLYISRVPPLGDINIYCVQTKKLMHFRDGKFISEFLARNATECGLAPAKKANHATRNAPGLGTIALTAAATGALALSGGLSPAIAAGTALATSAIGALDSGAFGKLADLIRGRREPIATSVKVSRPDITAYASREAEDLDPVRESRVKFSDDVEVRQIPRGRGELESLPNQGLSNKSSKKDTTATRTALLRPDLKAYTKDDSRGRFDDAKVSSEPKVRFSDDVKIAQIAQTNKKGKEGVRDFADLQFPDRKFPSATLERQIMDRRKDFYARRLVEQQHSKSHS